MDALILVDLQNDFMDDGALPVPGGYEVVPVANAVMAGFELVVATQDWHPAQHGSFAAQHPGHAAGDVVLLDGLEQVLWPVHCVQGDAGAELVHGLAVPGISQVFRKGTDPRIDSYSGFFDNGRRKSTGLADWLRARGVERVWVLGVATDYCVKFTALDAAAEGFATFLVEDACAGVELGEGDIAAAKAAMKAAGVTMVRSDALGR